MQSRSRSPIPDHIYESTEWHGRGSLAPGPWAGRGRAATTPHQLDFTSIRCRIPARTRPQVELTSNHCRIPATIRLQVRLPSSRCRGDGSATRAPEDVDVLARLGDPGNSLVGHVVAALVQTATRLVSPTAPDWRRCAIVGGVPPAPSSETSLPASSPDPLALARLRWTRCSLHATSASALRRRRSRTCS